MSITERKGRVELRWQHDDAGEEQFDEFVVYDKDGECIAHGEAMSDGAYWIGIPTGEGDERAYIWLSATKKGRMEMTGRWE